MKKLRPDPDLIDWFAGFDDDRKWKSTLFENKINPKEKEEGKEKETEKESYINEIPKFESEFYMARNILEILKPSDCVKCL